MHFTSHFDLSWFKACSQNYHGLRYTLRAVCCQVKPETLGILANQRKRKDILEEHRSRRCWVSPCLPFTHSHISYCSGIGSAAC